MKDPKQKKKLKKFSSKTNKVKVDMSATQNKQKKALQKQESEEESDYFKSDTESSEDYDDESSDEDIKKKGKKQAQKKEQKSNFAMEDTDKKEQKDIKTMFKTQQNKQQEKKETQQKQQQLKQATLFQMFSKRNTRKVSSDSSDNEQNKKSTKKQPQQQQQQQTQTSKMEIEKTPEKKKTPQKAQLSQQKQQQQQQSQQKNKSPMKIKDQFDLKKVSVKQQSQVQKPSTNNNQAEDLLNKDIDQIIDMGLGGDDREKVKRALIAAGNNLDRACDYLLNDNIPSQKQQQQPVVQQQQKKPQVQQQQQQQQKKPVQKSKAMFSKRKVSSSSDDLMEIEDESDDQVQVGRQIKNINLRGSSNSTTPQKPVQSLKPVQPLKPMGAKNQEQLAINEKSNKLDPLIFVFTGVMPSIDRDTAEKIVKNHGGKVTGSISGKTNYLVIGEKLEDGREVTEGSKYRKANEPDKKGNKKIVQIINEEEFGDLLQKKIGRKLEDFAKGNSLQSLLGAKPKGIQKASTISIQPKTSTQQQQQQPQQQLQQQQKVKSGLWTSWYAPKDIFECVGNNDKIKKVAEWLTDWEDVVIKKTMKKQVPVYKNWGAGGFPTTSNPNKPALLLSGPPGIGKTTTVRLLAKQMGYELIETNASDLRNKKGVDGLLNHLIDNQTLGFNKKEVETNNKKIILMDEVDGMSAGDRGGNQELIKKIDNTKTPIICICNDRQHQKVRSLANHCYDLEFSKPTAKQVCQRMMDIIQIEKLQIEEKTLMELIESLNCDIRQVLNCLQMWNKNGSKMTNQQFKQSQSIFKKDMEVSLTGFDAAKKLMNRNTYSQLKNIYEKINLFMIDYDQIPLIVQNQYLESNKKSNYNIKDIESMLDCANSIADGDIMNHQVRARQHWGLLPNMAMAAAIYPCENYCQQVPMIKFPQFLGKFSSQRKVYREVRELRQMLGHTVTGSRFSVKFDYARPLLQLIVTQLKKNNIDEAMDIMVQYNITPEILKEQLLDCQYPSPKNFDYLSNVDTKTKTALTKAWKARHSQNITKKKVGKKEEFQSGRNQDDFIVEDEYSDDYMEEEEEEEESQDVQAKKPATTKAKGKAAGNAGKTKKGKK